MKNVIKNKFYPIDQEIEIYNNMQFMNKQINTYGIKMTN